MTEITPEATPIPGLVTATDVAMRALQTITSLESIGSSLGAEVHDSTVATLFYECLLPGYPGWRWAACLAKLTDDDPVTVIEVELLPGEGSLVPPDWVPWDERLAAYRSAQAKNAEEETSEDDSAEGSDDDDDDDDLDEDDLLDNDFSGFDTDIDGVDIDALDSDADDSDDSPADEEE